MTAMKEPGIPSGDADSSALIFYKVGLELCVSLCPEREEL